MIFRPRSTPMTMVYTSNPEDKVGHLDGMVEGPGIGLLRKYIFIYIILLFKLLHKILHLFLDHPFQATLRDMGRKVQDSYSGLRSVRTLRKIWSLKRPLRKKSELKAETRRECSLGW